MSRGKTLQVIQRYGLDSRFNGAARFSMSARKASRPCCYGCRESRFNGAALR